MRSALPHSLHTNGLQLSMADPSCRSEIGIDTKGTLIFFCLGGLIPGIKVYATLK